MKTLSVRSSSTLATKQAPNEKKGVSNQFLRSPIPVAPLKFPTQVAVEAYLVKLPAATYRKPTLT